MSAARTSTAPRTGGDVYLKAVPPLFAREPRVTHALAGRHPRHVPPVLATHPARRWTLLGDAGASLRRVSDPAVWERVLRCYAEVQQAWGHEAGALLAVGCPDRRLPALAGDLDALAAALDARPGGPNASASDEVPRVTATRLRAAFEQALTLGAFFQAVSYHRIVGSLEPAARQEWAGALPAWLRRGLARLDASPG